MVQFDPIKIFKRMWEMSGWGRVLVVATIVLTVFAIVSSFSGIVTSLAIASAAIMWAMLVIYYLVTISQFKKRLDEIIVNGIWIQARLTGYTEQAIDRHGQRLDRWDKSVEKLLKGTEYEKLWRFNVGLTKPEDESQSEGYEQFLIVYKNYIALRLIRLKEIRDGL